MDKDILNLITTPEDHRHDFKEEWYGRNEKAEIARDILSFVNTTHHKDCYIFIGISDDLEIVGVDPNDSNRKNQNDFLDMIRHWPTANYIIPKVSLFEFKVDSKIIDVIRIFNTTEVPVYFNKGYPTKISRDKRSGEWQISPNQVFTRIGDVNTPRDSSADYNIIKDLWQKSFHLDLSIYKQYEYKLKDVSNWRYIENEDTSGFIYQLDPDYFILIEDDNMNRNQVEAYSIDVIDCRVGWDILKLKYRHLTIGNYMLTYLDGARGMLVPPDYGFIKKDNTFLETYSYYKYLKTDIRYILNQMIHTAFSNNSDFKHTLRNFVLPNIVIYEDKVEQEKTEENLIKTISEDLDSIVPDEEEISSARAKASQDVTDETHATSHAIKHILTQRNVARYINQQRY